MTTPIFTGVATALITPLSNEGVDYPALKKTLEWQLKEGIKTLVICGTTGEGSTLSDEEHRKVLDYAMEVVAGRATMIAATGSNDTAYGMHLTKEAANMNYDAALLVAPYYNKATQKGLIESYIRYAECADIPAILYNVPSRTGVNIEPSTYAVLAEHENIVGIKEAGGNLSQIVETLSLIGDKMALYSGNDDQIVPILACGGMGVISVLSNICPRQANRMCDLFFEGDLKGAMQLQLEMLDLINALFCEVNPIPVKAAMAEMGFCEDYLRLPLTSMEEAHRKHLFELMRKHGIGI